MRSPPAPRLPSACTLPSTRSRPSSCGGCSTAPRGSSDMRVACGLWRWLPRPLSKKVSPKGGSQARPFAPPSRAFSGYAGCGPRGGSLRRIPCMNEKKAARPTDGSGRSRSRMGHRFRGRMLVEPGGFAHFEPLLRGGEPTSDDPTVGRKGRPRAESRLLLRALPSAAGGHVDKVRRRKARKLHNHAVSLVVLGGARKARQESSSAHLGQRFLAHLQGGSQVARQTQSRSQEQRLWGEDRQLPFAETKSVAERYRAQVGSRQTEGCGVRWAARCV